MCACIFVENFRIFMSLGRREGLGLVIEITLYRFEYLTMCDVRDVYISPIVYYYHKLINMQSHCLNFVKYFIKFNINIILYLLSTITYF